MYYSPTEMKAIVTPIKKLKNKCPIKEANWINLIYITRTSIHLMHTFPTLTNLFQPLTLSIPSTHAQLSFFNPLEIPQELPRKAHTIPTFWWGHCFLHFLRRHHSTPQWSTWWWIVHSENEDWKHFGQWFSKHLHLLCEREKRHT
jgi:hypothetical protein